jgi:hypothetical protein
MSFEAQTCGRFDVQAGSCSQRPKSYVGRVTCVARGRGQEAVGARRLESCQVEVHLVSEFSS